jgi:hypothetical protein
MATYIAKVYLNYIDGCNSSVNSRWVILGLQTLQTKTRKWRQFVCTKGIIECDNGATFISL